MDPSPTIRRPTPKTSTSTPWTVRQGASASTSPSVTAWMVTDDASGVLRTGVTVSSASSRTSGGGVRFLVMRKQLTSWS